MSEYAQFGWDEDLLAALAPRARAMGIAIVVNFILII